MFSTHVNSVSFVFNLLISFSSFAPFIAMTIHVVYSTRTIPITWEVLVIKQLLAGHALRWVQVQAVLRNVETNYTPWMTYCKLLILLSQKMWATYFKKIHGWFAHNKRQFFFQWFSFSRLGDWKSFEVLILWKNCFMTINQVTCSNTQI